MISDIFDICGRGNLVLQGVSCLPQKKFVMMMKLRVSTQVNLAGQTLASLEYLDSFQPITSEISFNTMPRFVNLEISHHRSCGGFAGSSYIQPNVLCS